MTSLQEMNKDNSLPYVDPEWGSKHMKFTQSFNVFKLCWLIIEAFQTEVKSLGLAGNICMLDL